VATLGRMPTRWLLAAACVTGIVIIVAGIIWILRF
jgi:hypothetical protein